MTKPQEEKNIIQQTKKAKIKRLLDLTELNNPHENYTRQDYLIDEAFRNVKIFLGVLLVFIVSILGFWSVWNVKNILKIDLLPGPHHSSIDEINDYFGM